MIDYIYLNVGALKLIEERYRTKGIMTDGIDFSEMTLPQKLKALYEDGTFIVAIRYYGYKINLYLLKNFYVEVFYNHKEDRIEKVELLVMNGNSRMKFYTDQVRLPASIS